MTTSAKVQLLGIIAEYSESQALDLLSKLAGSSQVNTPPLQSQMMDVPRNDAAAAKRAARADRIYRNGNLSTKTQN